MTIATPPVTTDAATGRFFRMDGNIFLDANVIYEAGNKAMSGSKFKYSTQLFEMNHLLYTAMLQKSLQDGSYTPAQGSKFLIRERGKPRYITSNTMADKTVNHIICDCILTPSLKKYLIHDNGASQKGKGVDFHRRRFEAHLHKYFMATVRMTALFCLVISAGITRTFRTVNAAMFWRIS